MQGRGAHRVAYERLIGPVPDGLVLDQWLHPGDCIGPACVRCDHVRPTTIGANGRRERGNRCFSLRHELTGDNVVWWGQQRPYRLCRACKEERELRTGRRRRMRVTASLSIVAVSAAGTEVAA